MMRETELNEPHWYLATTTHATQSHRGLAFPTPLHSAMIVNITSSALDGLIIEDCMPRGASSPLLHLNPANAVPPSQGCLSYTHLSTLTCIPSLAFLLLSWSDKTQPPRGQYPGLLTEWEWERMSDQGATWWTPGSLGRERLKILVTRASLTAQWWRICLPVQEIGVRSLGQEDPTCHWAINPGHHNDRACALEPGNENHWNPRA